MAAKNSPHTILSILTAEPWRYDDEKCFIEFLPDGTGQIWMAFEYTPYLGADIRWKCQDPESLSRIIDIPKTRGLQHLAQFNINMTIENQPVPIFYSAGQHKIHPERSLAEPAFQPKNFTIHLEKGIFPAPICAMNPKDDLHARKYALRLVFDNSPYPPPEEWTDESNHSASGARVWKWTTFASQDLGPYHTSWLENCIVM